MDDRIPVVILGGGPAGLGAAFRLARHHAFSVMVVERNAHVGGNAGSFEIDGVPVDFGSHRLHPSCSDRVLEDIRSLLGDDLLTRPRHGRIRLSGRWVHFPLKPMNMAVSLPPSFLFGVARDAILRRKPQNGRASFASELEKGLGTTICQEFYFPYARKIWGYDPHDLDAEQARRRVSANSLGKVFRKVMKAMPGTGKSRGQIFYYPRKGFGQISDAYFQAALNAGVNVQLDSTVCDLETTDGVIQAITVRRDDRIYRYPTRLVLSTIPITRLVQAVRPLPPDDVLASADALRYRAMLLIYLVLDADRFTEYDAHYFPEANVAITRLSEPKNYGLTDLPGTTVLCAELPCSPEDPIWSFSDTDLKETIVRDLANVGLPIKVPIRRVIVKRLMNAYPIYTQDYREHFDRLDRWASAIKGLVSLGRQGLFAHDNTHHTLAMAYAACRCIESDGRFDETQWETCRREFESHVVED